MSETLAMKMLGRAYCASPRPYLREPALQAGPTEVWWLRLTIFRNQPPYVRIVDQYEVDMTTVIVTPGSAALPLLDAVDCWPRISHVIYRHGSWLDNSFYAGFYFIY